MGGVYQESVFFVRGRKAVTGTLSKAWHSADSMGRIEGPPCYPLSFGLLCFLNLFIGNLGFLLVCVQLLLFVFFSLVIVDREFDQYRKVV